MTKAFFLDIDGTLVSFQTHQVPTSTIEALNAAKKRGIKIFIATGRPQLLINNLQPLQERDLIDGYVTVNGSHCTIGQQTVYKGTMKLSEVKKVLKFCSKHERACIVVAEHDLCVCNERPIVSELFRIFLKVEYLPSRDFDDALNNMGDILQLTPFISKEEEKILFSDLSECENGRWHPAFTDITAKGNNKRKGIHEIIRHLGISPKDIMAFGDGGNDISMLHYAGISIAMGNANDDVKNAADYVTDSVDNDGIRNALRHFDII